MFDNMSKLGHSCMTIKKQRCFVIVLTLPSFTFLGVLSVKVEKVLAVGSILLSFFEVLKPFREALESPQEAVFN